MALAVSFVLLFKVAAFLYFPQRKQCPMHSPPSTLRKPPASHGDKIVPADALPPFTRITAEEIIRAVRSIKPGSAPGARHAPFHPDEFLHNPSSSSRGEILDSTRELRLIFAAGQAPVALAPWIASATLTPLVEKHLAHRTIAVG